MLLRRSRLVTSKRSETPITAVILTARRLQPWDEVVSRPTLLAYETSTQLRHCRPSGYQVL